MSQIKIIRDHNLHLSPIVVPLGTPKLDEQANNDVEMITPFSQTSVYGIIAPLIKVNDIVVNYIDIVYFELDNKGHIPTLDFIVQDPKGLMKGLQQPSSDNEVRIQILPKFENAYKKIDMVFYIDSCDDLGESGLSFSCSYKVLDLYKNHVKCLGEVTTYEALDKLSTECQLGFASNVEGTNDKRYLYCASESYKWFMNKIIETSGDDKMGLQSMVLYDYWIDYWNNINLVDIYERFLSVDSYDDMMIWASPLMDGEHDFSHFSKEDELYIQVPAIISNHPTNTSEDLSIESYQVVNNSTSLSKGSDRIISTYKMEDGEALDYLLTDGDQKKDLTTQYSYIGECYREYDYLLASECREMKYDKMKCETIEVVLNAPTLAITKGSKVDLHWYDSNNDLQNTKEGLQEEEPQTNINVPELAKSVNTDYGPVYQLNTQVSGQYYVMSNTIIYQDSMWQHVLTLTRPRDTKNSYVDGLTQEVEKQL